MKINFFCVNGERRVRRCLFYKCEYSKRILDLIRNWARAYFPSRDILAWRLNRQGSLIQKAVINAIIYATIPHMETTKLEQIRAKIDESEDCGSNHHNGNPNSYTRTDELETARWRQEVAGGTCGSEDLIFLYEEDEEDEIGGERRWVGPNYVFLMFTPLLIKMGHGSSDGF
ncbi:hypothetical protein RND81_04G034300 [Saponaria officinalis]|uniref:Uncharacterized protein n=1 Tax=Saponaria officinalis TaxID=3572 RepID=A0AAW1LHH4_SAPOF